MTQPLVSIIIPTYNRAHLIGETLDSVLAQTYTNWECIVVDDGSTDDTDKVLKTYCDKDARFKYVHRPDSHKPGGNGARNYGFELSKGEYVNWFDSDDLMLDVYLKNQIELFKINTLFVISSGFYVDISLKEIRKMNISNTSYLFKEFLLWKQEIITNSVLFKRSFLKGKDLFNMDIYRGQETELFSRLFFGVDNGCYIINRIPLFLYREHEESKTFRNKKYIKRYKESLSFIAIENLKRSLLINDKELIIYHYRQIIGYFFRSVENNHKLNSKFILKELVSIFKTEKSMFFVELFLLGNIVVLFNRGSYRIEKKWKNYFKF